MIGFTSLGGVQIVTHAAEKQGDTQVTYIGVTPEPSDWGISVSSKLSLEKDNTGSYAKTFKIANAKVEIVSAEGSDFTADKNRTFEIKGISSNNGALVSSKDPNKKFGLNAFIEAENSNTAEDDTFLPGYGFAVGDSSQLRVDCNYNVDKTKMPVRHIKFYIPKVSLPTLEGDEVLQNTVSWTAAVTTPK